MGSDQWDLVLVAFSAAMGISMSVSATEIHVMSGGAPQEVFALDRKSVV